MTETQTSPKIAHRLNRVDIRGFGPFRECTAELGAMNVLLGPNGAGKSCFLEMFEMLGAMVEGRLQQYVAWKGGPDELLHYGRETTRQMSLRLHFEEQGMPLIYSCVLEVGKGNTLVFANETVETPDFGKQELGAGHVESRLAMGCTAAAAAAGEKEIDWVQRARACLRSWQIYDFQDMGPRSRIRSPQKIEDNVILRKDFANIASFLYLLQKQYRINFESIEQTVNLLTRIFDRLVLEPCARDRNRVVLRFKPMHSDVVLDSACLSPGSLRFLCLVTALRQPRALQKDLLLLDGPELSLLPRLMPCLAALFKEALREHQIVIATQNSRLLDQFSAQDVLVVDRENGLTASMHRIDTEFMKSWLEEDPLSELWDINLFGGNP